jgi:hypothetical protein
VALPFGVVKTIDAAPDDPAGVEKLTDESLRTCTLVAALPPTVIEVVPVKSAPVIVNDVPPAVDPYRLDKLEIVGATDGASVEQV